MPDNNTYGFNSDGVKQIVDTVRAVKRGNLVATAQQDTNFTKYEQWFWGKVTGGGGSSMYTVVRQQISNTDADSSDAAVTFADDASDYAMTVSALNIGELFSNVAPNLLPVDGTQIVRVWWEWDIDQNLRYVFDRPYLPPLSIYQGWYGTAVTGGTVVVQPDFIRAV